MIYEQTDPANIWMVEHLQNTISPIVDVWLSSPNGPTQILPREVAVLDEDHIRIIFTSPQVGGVAVNTSTSKTQTYTHTQALASNHWVVQHALDSKFVNIDVVVFIDGKYQTILPKSVTLPDSNTAIVDFSNPMNGFARVGA